MVNMNYKTVFKTWQRYFEGKNFMLIFSLATGMIFMQSSLLSQAKSDTSFNDIIIHQEIDFKVPPQQVYQTLLSSKEFSACVKKSFTNFTEMSATIDSTVGGSFSLFDGHIAGRIL